jgi:hypothetical protein
VAIDPASRLTAAIEGVLDFDLASERIWIEAEIIFIQQVFAEVFRIAAEFICDGSQFDRRFRAEKNSSAVAHAMCCQRLRADVVACRGAITCVAMGAELAQNFLHGAHDRVAHAG